MTGLRVYLAGPDVFLRNAEEIANAKRELCSKHGFLGVSPVDNEIDISRFSKEEAMVRISSANEQMIRSCQLIIANLTPFRGPSADVGTAYEIGFGRALGIPAFGYTNSGGDLLERTRRELGTRISSRSNGQFRDSYDMAIENFGGVDNLMLVGAVLSSGSAIVIRETSDEFRFTDLSGFEACLQLAAKQLGRQSAAGALWRESSGT